MLYIIASDSHFFGELDWNALLFAFSLYWKLKKISTQKTKLLQANKVQQVIDSPTLR